MSAVLLIAIPLLVAFVSILSKKLAPWLLLATPFVNLVLLFLVPTGIVVIGGFQPPFGISLLLDTYSFIALFAVNALVFVIGLLNVKEYHQFSSILLVALAGLNGLILTNDLFNLFVFLEIAGIAAYLIAASNKKPASVFHYLVLGAVGSSFYLFGLIILYAMFGTLNMVDMIEKINAATVSASALILPFFLMFVGLGVEAKLLPFNSWVKGVLGSSNTMSGPMFASVYAVTVSFVFGRLLNNLFAFQGNLLVVVVAILLLGIALGEAMAFSSKKAREILLYSSIAQASVVILLFVNGLVLWGALLAVANAVSKFVLFYVVTKAQKEVGCDDLDSLQGMFQGNYVVGVAFSVAALSVIGIPLFAGFVLKLGYLTELAANANWLAIAVILVASLVEGIYYVRMLVKLWYPGEKEVKVSFGNVATVVIALAAALLLVFGVYRGPIDNLDNTIDSVSEVIDLG